MAYPGYNFGGFGGQMMRPPGQFPAFGGGPQQMQPLGQLPGQGGFQMPQTPGAGGQQMQPLGMGQMPTNGGQPPMLGQNFMASPQAQSFIQSHPALQNWLGGHPGFNPAQFSYGMGMGLLGQNMSPGFRPFASALGQLGMQRMMNRGAPVG